MKKYKLKPKAKDILDFIALLTIVVAFIAVAMVGMSYSAKQSDKRLADQKKTEMSVTQISQIKNLTK